MSSHPDFHFYFETDALVRLELHCKHFCRQNLSPKSFLIFTYKWQSVVLAWSAANSQIFTKSLRETIDRYNLELAHVISLMYSLLVCQIGSNVIFHAIISEIGPHGPVFRGAVTKELRHGSL